jgi:3-dehydroquinate synthase
MQVDVELGSRSYPIVIGRGLLGAPGTLARHVAGPDALIVTNDVVGPLYLDAARRGLEGRRVGEVVLPDGEAHKNLAAVERVVDALVAGGFHRDATVVALGGGVVGDIAGFAAACYQRGVDFLQVPTTLLAQVDSSVGGKTGVNHSGGKNLVGAFHQPTAVVVDTDTLATLPDRELSAGLAEVVKYGAGLDATFFAWLEGHMEALVAREPEALAAAIRRCCELKAAVVAEDERERGRRALLNLGHTFGHAIETVTGYGEWLHGEAVAAGMVMAARLSERLGWIAPEVTGRLVRLLEAAGLPTVPPRAAPQALREAMQMDKKVLGGRLRLVLFRALGEAVVTADVPEEAVAATLEAAA